MRAQRQRPIRLLPVFAVGLAAVLAVVLAGCQRGDDNASGGLVGTTWTVTTIDGLPTLPDSPPTMAFAPDGVSGSTGCNIYGGPFRTDGNRFTVEPLMMTEMACDDPRSAQEATFAKALAAATSWRLTEQGWLELGGAAVIVAVPANQALAPQPGGPDDPTASQGDLSSGALPGTTWILVEIGGTADLARIVPTLDLGPDGSASGSGGCNTFSATFAIDGDALTFGAIGSTKMGCGRPAAAVENAYLSVLQATTGWSMDADGRLILEGAGGRLAFTPG